MGARRRPEFATGAGGGVAGRNPKPSHRSRRSRLPPVLGLVLRLFPHVCSMHRTRVQQLASVMARHRQSGHLQSTANKVTHTKYEVPSPLRTSGTPSRVLPRYCVLCASMKHLAHDRADLQAAGLEKGKEESDEKCAEKAQVVPSASRECGMSD